MSSKFNVLVDVILDEVRYKKFLDYSSRPDNWDNKIEYVQQALLEQCATRGLSVSFDTQEVDRPLNERLSESRSNFLRADALEELEEEVLSNKRCIGGSCED